MNKEDQELRHEKWRKLINEQEESGLTQADFCLERNISTAQMSYYRGLFKPKPVQTGAFSPVCIKQASSSKDIRITLPNGFQCVFPSDLNTSQIKEWMMVLLSC